MEITNIISIEGIYLSPEAIKKIKYLQNSDNKELKTIKEGIYNLIRSLCRNIDAFEINEFKVHFSALDELCNILDDIKKH